MAHDEALLNEARIDLNRYQEAFNRNAIAKQQLDDQNQTVLQYEGSVKNDQGTVDTAKVNLIYTKITAPITGRVGLRLVDPGNIVQGSSSTPLVVITQLQPITGSSASRKTICRRCRSSCAPATRCPWTPSIVTRPPQLSSGSCLPSTIKSDTSTGTLKLESDFQNSDLTLFPNQFVNARLLVDTQQNATLIPVAAIQRNAKGAFVYVIKPDSTASLQNITVGTTDGNTSAVQGIQPNAVVATTGFDKLQEGAKVAVHNNAPTGAGAGQNANTDGSTNKGPDASTGSSTRAPLPGSKQSDSATPNTSTSSSGSQP